MTLTSIANLVSFATLLGGSMIFGLLGKPTEMGLIEIAGALGLAFSNLDKFSRFKGAGFEAEIREKFDAIIEKETEPEPQPEGKLPELHGGDRVEAYGLVGEDALKIIKTLGNPKYTWRYVGGIAKESGCSKEKVKELLTWLEANELARESTGIRGSSWALTIKGRQVFAQYND